MVGSRVGDSVGPFETFDEGEIVGLRSTVENDEGVSDGSAEGKTLGAFVTGSCEGNVVG